MKSDILGGKTVPGGSAVRTSTRTLAVRPALEQWISAQEIRELGEALARGNLPFDLAEKLGRMKTGDLSVRFIEQNCHLFAALLHASEQGDFREASRVERERLVSVLAYVRKDHDGIPDYLADGFTDDRQEILATTVELGPLLQAFKAWRLRHQVPLLWAVHGATRAYA